MDKIAKQKSLFQIFHFKLFLAFTDSFSKKIKNQEIKMDDNKTFKIFSLAQSSSQYLPMTKVNKDLSQLILLGGTRNQQILLRSILKKWACSAKRKIYRECVKIIKVSA